MSALPSPESALRMTEAEYLEFEEAAETKHEYVDGYVYDWPGYDYGPEGMVGARVRHNRLQVNFLLAVGGAARAAGCQAFGSDLKLRVRNLREHGYYYPDAMVVCEPAEVRSPQADEAVFVTRPCIIVEIVSQRSVRIDHTEKLQTYQAIPSVEAYLIVHQQEHRVEYHARSVDGSWPEPTILTSGDSVRLPCIDCDLSVDSIYA